jgi:hypothetical protein
MTKSRVFGLTRPSNLAPNFFFEIFAFFAASLSSHGDFKIVFIKTFSSGA